MSERIRTGVWIEEDPTSKRTEGRSRRGQKDKDCERKTGVLSNTSVLIGSQGHIILILLILVYFPTSNLVSRFDLT